MDRLAIEMKSVWKLRNFKMAIEHDFENVLLMGFFGKYTQEVHIELNSVSCIFHIYEYTILMEAVACQ